MKEHHHGHGAVYHVHREMLGGGLPPVRWELYGHWMAPGIVAVMIEGYVEVYPRTEVERGHFACDCESN